MFVNGLGTANPAHRYSKSDCWEAFKASDWFRQLDRRAHMIAETVLLKDNGIAWRSLAVRVARRSLSASTPIRCTAGSWPMPPRSARRPPQSALQEAGLAAREIDGVVISTCTGYLCPGLTSYVIERLGLRADVLAFDLVGQGCAAALPNWRLADALLAAGSCRHVLSICVEVSSAAMYLDNDPGVLISACLFGDGAGAAVLSRDPNPHRRASNGNRSRRSSIRRSATRCCSNPGMACCATS